MGSAHFICGENNETLLMKDIESMAYSISKLSLFTICILIVKIILL